MRTSKVYFFRACHSKSQAPSQVSAKTQRQAETWESFTVGKGEAPGMPWLEKVSMGTAKWEVGNPLWLFGLPIWLSLVSPKLEAGTVIREAVHYQPSPGCWAWWFSRSISHHTWILLVVTTSDMETGVMLEPTATVMNKHITEHDHTNTPTAQK